MLFRSVIRVDLQDTANNFILDLDGMATTTDIVRTDDGKIVVSSRNNNGGAEVHVRSSSLSAVYGQVEVGDHVNALAAKGDYIFIASANNNELGIMDHTDCLGALEGYGCNTKWYDVPQSTGELSALTLHDDTLYVGRTNGYLHILDVSDPLDPSHEYAVDTGSAALTDIAPDERNNVILVSTDGASTKEVLVVDLSNSDVVPVDLVGAQSTDAIIRHGNLAYVAARDNEEIQILRGGLGGWIAPQFVDDYDIDGGADGRAMYVAQGKSFVITGTVLTVFDVSDPGNIQLLDSLDAGFTLQDVVAQGDYIYVATNHNQQELITLDMSDPQNITPVPGGIFNSEGGQDGISVELDGDRLYLGTRKNTGGQIGRAHV